VVSQTLRAEAFRRRRQRRRFIQPRCISLVNCATTLLANSSAMSASAQNATMDALFPAEVEWNVRLKSWKMRKIRLSTHCLLLFVRSNSGLPALRKTCLSLSVQRTIRPNPARTPDVPFSACGQKLSGTTTVRACLASAAAALIMTTAANAGFKDVVADRFFSNVENMIVNLPPRPGTWPPAPHQDPPPRVRG
jgi:hypothetical protein